MTITITETANLIVTVTVIRKTVSNSLVVQDINEVKRC